MKACILILFCAISMLSKYSFSGDEEVAQGYKEELLLVTFATLL